MTTGAIGSQYATDDADRLGVLEAARRCAALTKPWYLPPQNQNKDQKLPETYQSIGPRGASNVQGKLVNQLFGPGRPWFRRELDESIKYDRRIDTKTLQAMEQALYIQELLIQSVLESAGLKDSRSNARRQTFRTRKYVAIGHCVITGDVLEQMTDDYKIKVFRRDQYVTKRDSSGDVIYHIVVEKIDPFTLTDGQRSKLKLSDADLKGKSAAERSMDLYTRCEWQQWSRKWVIQQEIGKDIINESEEPVTPFFSTPYELVPPENYGRGLIEQHRGDLRSLDNISERLLDFAALASKHHPVIDESSEIRETDISQPTGMPLRGRVVGGIVQDVGWLRVEKTADFNVARVVREELRKDLGKAMLIESETAPTGESGRSPVAHQRVALELEGMVGGVYASISDAQQIQPLERCIYQLERDKLLPPLPKGAVKIKLLTGIDALSREADAAKLVQLSQVAAAFGPEALAKVDIGVLIDIMARYQRIDEPGLIKSNEQVEAERQAAMQQQARIHATEKAIDVAGNVAEASALAQ